MNRESMAFIGMKQNADVVKRSENSNGRPRASGTIVPSDLITIDGVTDEAGEFCKRNDVIFSTFRTRFLSGKSLKDSLSKNRIGGLK